jgi:serine/threonine protein kinase
VKERAGGVRVGRYEVELPLGQNAVGEVILARDPLLGRRVVLKRLRADAPLDDEARGRLTGRLRETASALGALSHPGIVTVHDAGEGSEGEPGAPYVVFECVAGPTLRERLAAGALAPVEVASIGRALGSALTGAHAAGFTHGDVKPENVMLPATGPKLMDPGFTRLARDETVTPFDDQHALAVTLYEALTGKRPLDAEARQPPSVVAPRLRSFPHVDTIFGRALAVDPRKRFSSCEVLGGVLATELEGVEPGRIAAISTSSIVPRSTRRWQNAAAGIAVLVIVALIVLGRQRRPDEGASLRTVASGLAPASAPSPRAPPAPSSAAHHAHSSPSSSSAAPGVPVAVPASSGSAGAEAAAPLAGDALPPAPPASSEVP